MRLLCDHKETKKTSSCLFIYIQLAYLSLYPTTHVICLSVHRWDEQNIQSYVNSYPPDSLLRWNDLPQSFMEEDLPAILIILCNFGQTAIVKIHRIPINCHSKLILEVVLSKVERFCPVLKFQCTVGQHCMNLSVTEPPQCLAKHMHCWQVYAISCATLTLPNIYVLLACVCAILYLC